MYGKQTAVTAQQAYESSRRNGGAGSVLTQEQFTKAFNTGRSSKDARIQNSAARQRGEGKVYFGQDVDYGGERYKAASEDMVSSAELDVIKTLAKITGTDVVFYQSEADMSGRYKGANGFMRNGTMYLDVNAGANRTSEESAVLLTAAHELTHYIRENNAEGYAQLRDFVTRHLIEDGADIEALAEQKAARENGLLSMDEAVEEVIADSCEMMLEDTKLPEIMAKENPGLYEQIREWIANFAEKLRKAFTGVEARHAEAKAMMQYADELSRIWDSALAGAVRNTESGTTAPNNGTQTAQETTRRAPVQASTESRTPTQETTRETKPGMSERTEPTREQRTAAEEQAAREFARAQIQYHEEHGWDAALPKELESDNFDAWTDARAKAILEAASGNAKYSTRESFADYTNGKQLIKSAKDRDRVCSAVEKKLSEMVSRGSIEDFDVDKSRGMGSYETFYIRVEFNEDADGYGNSMEIRFSGHNQQYGGADVYMYDGGYAGVKELTAAVEKEIKRFAEENGIPYGNTEATTAAGKTKYSLREYSEEQKENWAHSKRIVIYSDEAHLRQFIRDARENKNSEKKMYFGRVPANMAEEVLKNTGLDIDGFNCSLSAYEIQKIFKDHGQQSTEGPRGQRAITEDDIVSIPDILQNADQIKLSPKLYNGKPVINFTAIGNDRVTVTAYVSDKHLDLAVQTMFANIKKGNLATLTDEQASVDTPEAGRGTVSNNTIPQSGEESNTKYSMRERDEDLQKKYPRLNLNEDISDLDGVPAIELTDGSILPIKDRERYRTHVSFIEGNRIDVDDLRSGGWIGNGVYDASFTSDTARYIERQQAKKRVAELRGVPYDQFGDGNTRYSMRDVAEDDTADERRGRQESYAELRRQNEELRRRAEYWKGQTRTTKEATVRKADTDALARRLAEELYNKGAADTVKEELKRMGDYIVQTDGQELSYAELKDWAAAIADHILSGSEAEIESGMEDARRELLDYLKSNKLKINEREMLDLPEGWKREHRRIRFGKEGLPIDTAWMELQEKFGEGAFPSSITSQSDMLFHIADMERAWQPVRGNPFENYMGEMRETVAQDILDTMLSDEIRQTAKTAADRARDRMNKAVAEERTRYNDMKSRMQERIQQVYQEGVARKQEAVAKEKAAKWEKVEQTRNYYQQMMQNAQQRRRENAGFSTIAHQNRVFFVFSQRKPPLNKTRRPQGLRVISSYSSCFHIVALITRLTDREALAGKYAVFAHIIKQLVTAYAAVYEAYSVVLLCKLPHGVLAVYVIHSYSRMRCDIPIYKALQHLCFKSVNEKAAASRSAHIIHFSAAAARKLRFQSAQQIIDIRIEEHTVYRLKVHALVMYVYKLSQSILCFRGAYERRRSLCRGERMVAVSHGKKHPLPLFPTFLRKRRESGEYAPLLILGNEPAAKVSAAEHKVKIIELRELRRVYAFYYLPALIVHEDHDMRQLQRSIPADIDARRYAREHRPLRGADEAFCPGLIAVILQRKCADDAAASSS